MRGKGRRKEVSSLQLRGLDVCLPPSLACHGGHHSALADDCDRDRRSLREGRGKGWHNRQGLLHSLVLFRELRSLRLFNGFDKKA